jgi:hypothetical protein
MSVRTLARNGLSTSKRLARSRSDVFDVKIAFLNNDIDLTIYIEQPLGFEQPNCPVKISSCSSIKAYTA